jgi:hypothetical protein
VLGKIPPLFQLGYLCVGMFCIHSFYAMFVYSFCVIC